MARTRRIQFDREIRLVCKCGNTWSGILHSRCESCKVGRGEMRPTIKEEQAMRKACGPRDGGTNIRTRETDFFHKVIAHHPQY